MKKIVKDLPTSALLIDLDIFEHNLQTLVSYRKGRPVSFRPHAKAHKSPAVASCSWRPAPKIGDQVQIMPGHCDTTVNLHNVFFAVRKGMVEHVWTIEGRGRTD